MDRWQNLPSGNISGEAGVVYRQGGVRLYDGDRKAGLEDVYVQLTSHRLIVNELCLHLSMVTNIEKEEGGFMRSDKLILHLAPVNGRYVLRTGARHTADFVKLSFRSGGQAEFFTHLDEVVRAKGWEPKEVPQQLVKGTKREIRAGITGIEKKINMKAKQDKASISKAFGDLDKLMEMAKPMVILANSISSKIRDRQGEITEDETVKFKSYLLSLGIDDPITKDSAGSDKAYYSGLAKEMFLILDQPIQETGGMMTLTDAFVRVNRARGLELVSPDDLLSACKSLTGTQLPMSLHTFPSGVMVLTTASHNKEEARQSLLNMLESSGSLTAEELSQCSPGLSVVLGRERLLDAETEGCLVRDDSVEGLRFYPNMFLSREH